MNAVAVSRVLDSSAPSPPPDLDHRVWKLAFSLPRGHGTLPQVVQAFAVTGLSAISVMRDPLRRDRVRYELTTRSGTHDQIGAAVAAIHLPLEAVRIG